MFVLMLVLALFGSALSHVSTGNGTIKDTPVPPCSHAPYTFQNSEYFIQPVLKGGWIEAVEYCDFINMELVSIETTEENDFILSIVRSLSGVFSYNFWTSGKHYPTRGWIWMSTGRNIIYANWAPQPKRAGDCMQIMYVNNERLYWDSQDCSAPNYVICEKRL